MITQAELSNFTGTENYYRHPLGILFTDGVRYVAEQAQAFWLVDLIVSWQPEVTRKIKREGDRNFQVWTLAKREGHAGFRITCTNGNDGYLAHQDIVLTDFPENLMPFALWCIDGVIILPSEY